MLEVDEDVGNFLCRYRRLTFGLISSQRSQQYWKSWHRWETSQGCEERWGLEDTKGMGQGDDEAWKILQCLSIFLQASRWIAFRTDECRVPQQLRRPGQISHQNIYQQAVLSKLEKEMEKDGLSICNPRHTLREICWGLKDYDTVRKLHTENVAFFTD